MSLGSHAAMASLDHAGQMMPDANHSDFSLSQLEGVWHTRKDYYKEAVIAFHDKILIGGMNVECTFVQLVVPQLHKHNEAATSHALLKAQVAHFEGLMSTGLIRDALNYQIQDYIDRFHGGVIMLDLTSTLHNRLRVRSVTGKPGLFELLHHLRQYLLYYLKDKHYMNYKTWNMDSSRTFNTANYRIYMPEVSLSHGGRGETDHETDLMIQRRSKLMARELLQPSLWCPPSTSAAIGLRVDINSSDWPYLVQNGFILPREQCMCVGNAEMPCELLPETLVSVHCDRDFTAAALALSAAKSPFAQDELVLRRGEPAVVVSVDTTLLPHTYVIRTHDGKELGCEAEHLCAVGNGEWLQKLLTIEKANVLALQMRGNAV
jgi:hypothetical protein